MHPERGQLRLAHPPGRVGHRVDPPSRRIDSHVPASRPHLRPSRPGRFDQRVRRSTTPTVCPCCSKSCRWCVPRGCSPCPGCSRRSTTAPRRRPMPTARGRSSTSPPVPRSTSPSSPNGARCRSRPGPCMAVFDKLVYSKLREVFGGRCEYAISGAAALGERLGHFFRDRDHGARGVRPHGNVGRVDGEPAGRRSRSVPSDFPSRV
jgi:hypothetical protein